VFFFSSRRRHTRFSRDWSSDVCSSDLDVLAPSYREYGAQIMRGVRLREILLYWGGDERGNDFEVARHDFPWAVPIATQCLHAAEIGRASCRESGWGTVAAGARRRKAAA